MITTEGDGRGSKDDDEKAEANIFASSPYRYCPQNHHQARARFF
jgi:hypothetical protein